MFVSSIYLPRALRALRALLADQADPTEHSSLGLIPIRESLSIPSNWSISLTSRPTALCVRFVWFVRSWVVRRVTSGWRVTDLNHKRNGCRGEAVIDQEMPSGRLPSMVDSRWRTFPKPMDAMCVITSPANLRRWRSPDIELTTSSDSLESVTMAFEQNGSYEASTLFTTFDS